MKVEILYSADCPNFLPARDRLKAILAEEGFNADLLEIEVIGSEPGFIGSPTIRVNGLDIEAGARELEVNGAACRLYDGGLPSESMIRMALREAYERA